MKKRTLLAAGTLTVLLLTGCSASSSAETEALKEQVAQLEQQIADLQAANSADDAQAADAQADGAQAADAQAGDAQAADAQAGDAQTPAETQGTQTTIDPAAGAGATTYTLEELTTMVNDYVAKAEAATPSGSNDIEQFFSLEQEANQEENELERHEDELERQYRDGALTRDEYRANERELDHLDDLLDAAEDQLEYVFGIDD